MQNQSEDTINSYQTGFDFAANNPGCVAVPPVAEEVSDTRPHEPAGQSWESLEVAFLNGSYQPARVRFRFPRSAKPFDVRIVDLRGRTIRQFHVSSESQASSVLR